MVDKGTILQLFGSLMHKPELLAERDRYNLNLNDFSTNFERIIFMSIYNLYENGVQRITAVDVDNYLNTNLTSKKIFETNRGIEYLEDAYEFSDPDNFNFYYKRFKKLSALRDLKKAGYSISDIYEESPINPKAKEINEKFEEMEVGDIFSSVKKKLMMLESEYGVGDSASSISAEDGLEALIHQLRVNPELAAPLQGDYFNTIARGARKGKFYIRAAASSVGKSRLAVGDACYLAYPIRFNTEKWEWEVNGSNEKTLFIMTEQEFEEIQTMILAYLTGFNEEKILFGSYSEAEIEIVEQALKVMKTFENNLILVQMPNPSIEKIKSVVRQNWILHGIQNVFYDYIFISPSMLNEFRDLKLRNDEALLMFSSALKDLAVELGIFVMTSTQLNAKGESDEKDIKNEASIRGSRAIIDKCDIGVIVSRIKEEEKETLAGLPGLSTMPNQVVDVFKVRRGRYTQLKIWMDSDLGTCRRRDLFVTDAHYNLVEGLAPIKYNFNEEHYLEWKELAKGLNQDG